jgi:hypothetical protein
MRLFLVAAFPLALSVAAQMSIGLKKIKLIALSSLAGSLVNLPMSCYLTARLGVVGVIWGTVLTTLFSNLLVPAPYLFRVLQIDPRIYLRNSLGAPLAGAAGLLLWTAGLRLFMPISFAGASQWSRAVPLLVHLSSATLAYLAGYALVPAGRADLEDLLLKIRRRGGRDPQEQAAAP